MPKTYNNLWSNLVSFENLYAAYHVARSGHREHMEVHKFEKNLEENLINIQNHLIWHSWTPDPFLEFVVHEPKERRIQAPTFRDRVVHHAYYQIVGPLFEKKFISHTYACIPGRGPLKAAEKAHEYIKSFPKGKRVYVIYGDMKGYFPSIDHAYLKEQTRRTIKDPDVLWLGDTLIDANGQRTGLGIGALPSQLYAGVNLDPFDHYMKDDLGVKRYIRYMDDWVVISDDKQYLERILVLAKDFLTGNPKLVINPKTRIIPITHGLDYCGYRIFRDYLLPRKRNLMLSSFPNQLLEEYVANKGWTMQKIEMRMSVNAKSENRKATKTEVLVGNYGLCANQPDLFLQLDNDIYPTDKHE